MTTKEIVARTFFVMGLAGFFIAMIGIIIKMIHGVLDFHWSNYVIIGGMVLFAVSFLIAITIEIYNEKDR